VFCGFDEIRNLRKIDILSKHLAKICLNQWEIDFWREKMMRKARNRDPGHDILLGGKWKPPD
jgi:hypothetical protein